MKKFDQIRLGFVDASKIFDGLSLWERVKLAVMGRIYVGDYTHEGWSGSLPHYLIYCDRHGLCVTYPSGYDRKLLCDKCIEEWLNDRNIVDISGAKQNQGVKNYG